MTQQVKALAVTPDMGSSILAAHRSEGKMTSYTCPLTSTDMLCHVMSGAHMHHTKLMNKDVIRV